MEQASENGDRADNLGIVDAANVDADKNTDTNGADNPGIVKEGAIGNSDKNGNSKTRCFKIVNFSINHIILHSYFLQLTTKIMKLKNLLKLKQPVVTKTTVATVKLTPDILNLISFLSIIEEIILSN